MTQTDWPKEPLTSEMMLVLDGILRKLCTERGVCLDSKEAQKAAKGLVDWFEFGVRDPDELARVIRDEVTLDRIDRRFK